MEPNREHRWEVSGQAIPVEFVVLHYTAETLEETLRLFADPAHEVGAHLVIAEDGCIWEIAPNWDGDARIAFHAGASRYKDGDGREWTNFNDFSIGIELVNPNGNAFRFTDEQYETLSSALSHLMEIYPSLRDPGRVVGHEQISGWRGKVDPGALFDWERLFGSTYPERAAPRRAPACPAPLSEALERFRRNPPLDPSENAEYWRAINFFLEKTVGYIRRQDALADR